MKYVLMTILIILGLAILAGIGGGVLVIIAYGIGWVLTRFLPFTLFEATVLSLAGFAVFAFIVIRIVSGTVPSPSQNSAAKDDWDEDEEDDWDEDWDEEDEEVEDDDAASQEDYPGIPRWRQPSKKLDFTNVKPDDRCPCGSGRKYKNCHGFKVK